MSELADRLEDWCVDDPEQTTRYAMNAILREAAERLRENETALAEQENCSRGWQALYTEAVERLRENEKDAEEIILWTEGIDLHHNERDAILSSARRIAGKDEG